MNDLSNNLDDNYFMRPTYIQGIGNIYPIKYREYTKFKQLADTFIVDDLTNITNKGRIQFQEKQKQGLISRAEKYKPKHYDCLYDWLIETTNNINEARKSLVNQKLYLSKIDKQDLINYKQDTEFREVIDYLTNDNLDLPTNGVYDLFKMLLKNDVILANGVFNILDENKNKVGEINRNNFELFRTVVMQNNLLYKPVIGYDLNSNKMIQQALKTKNKNNGSFSIETMLAVVSITRHLSDAELQDYTYYRLTYDFKVISKMHFNNLSFICSALGGETDGIFHLSEEIKLIDNPYDGLFNKPTTGGIDNMLQKG